jgi:squalene-associated FAD-dependent desaturase
VSLADQVSKARRIAIVGAGYAGLAAAVELTRMGVAVEVFEASRTLGGRARVVEIDGLRFDNGAHILVGAYTETLRLMRLVNSSASVSRHPLRLEYPGEMRLSAPAWLPAPFHMAWGLVAARGLTLAEKVAAIMFMNDIKAKGFRLAADSSATELLATQPERVRRHLWAPLCLAALNTPVDRASAQVFLNVLRDSLAASREASDLLLPICDLSAMFPDPAAHYLESHGGIVHSGSRIEALARRGDGYFLDSHGPFAQVVLAVAPYHLPALIAGLPELATLSEQVAAFEWQPIVTCYLRYAEPISLPWSMIGVADGYAQWLFDLGRLRGLPGTIAAVISARGRHQALGNDELAAHIHEEIARVVPGLKPPVWSRVITEQRATFACTPNLSRPQTATALPGVWLAGDYVASDYPATIESAVRSGVQAATSALQQATCGQA